MPCTDLEQTNQIVGMGIEQFNMTNLETIPLVTILFQLLDKPGLCINMRAQRCESDADRGSVETTTTNSTIFTPSILNPSQSLQKVTIHSPHSHLGYKFPTRIPQSD